MTAVPNTVLKYHFDNRHDPIHGKRHRHFLRMYIRYERIKAKDGLRGT